MQALTTNSNTKSQLKLKYTQQQPSSAYKDLSYPCELYKADGTFTNVVKSFLNLTPRVLEYYFDAHNKQAAQGSAVIRYPREITITTVSTTKRQANATSKARPINPNRLLASPSVLYGSILSLSSDIDSIEPLPYSESSSSLATETFVHEQSQLRYTVIEPSSSTGSTSSLAESATGTDMQVSGASPDLEESNIWELPYLTVVEKVLLNTQLTELWISDRINHRLPVPTVVKVDCARLKRAAQLVLRLREGPKTLTASSVAVCGATGGAGLVAAGLVQGDTRIANSLVDSAANLVGSSALLVKNGLSLLCAMTGVTLAVQHVQKSKKIQRKELLQAAYEVNYILKSRDWRDAQLHAERVSSVFGKPIVHDHFPEGPHHKYGSEVRDRFQNHVNHNNHVQFSPSVKYADDNGKRVESNKINAVMGEQFKKQRSKTH